MKQNKLHKKKFQIRKDDIVINIEARQVIKFFRWVFGWKRRKRERMKNELIENTRQIHIAQQHRLAKDQWRG